MSKRKASSDNPGTPPLRKSQRLKAQPPPVLQSLTVTWGPADNEANKISFHVRTTATLNDVGGVALLQEYRDGTSIRAGTDPGNIQYQQSIFLADKKGAMKTSDTTLDFDDYPGYSADLGLHGDTDLRYTFGAQWKVTWGGTILAATTPLFGTIQGTGPGRTFTPAASVTATWNNTTHTWTNRGSLVEVFPDWGQYPVPNVNNTLTEDDSDSDE